MIRIIAYDLATLTGWATNVRYTDVPITSGTAKFDVKRGASPGVRFFEFVKWLENQINCFNPDLIVYEQAHHRGGAATEIAVGFATHLQSVCFHKGIEHVAIPTSQVKIFATGKGKAEKEEMMLACAEKLGIIPEDDNHADALWLLAYGEANYDKVPMVPYQRCSPAQRKKCKELQDV